MDQSLTLTGDNTRVETPLIGIEVITSQQQQLSGDEGT